MTRPLLLSNGTLHVGINLYGMVHDLYYPHVGLENHAAAQHMRHRIGVWVDGQFGWLDDGSWQFNMRYDPHGLIGHFTAHSDALQVTLDFTDCVDSEWNVFLRNIQVINAAKQPREIRLFLHQMILVSNSLNRDTGQYLPDQQAILHYKGHRAFVVGAKDSQQRPFNQFSIGLFGIEGHEGVWRDAEDGMLSGNPVEFGQVDSVVGFSLQLRGLESTRVYYWLCAAKTQTEAIAQHSKLQKMDITQRFGVTADYWRRWLRPAEKHIAALPKDMQQPFRDSLLIVKSQIDHQGGVVASTDTTMLNYSRDSYAYCWPRDGAYALWPLLRLGYKAELKNYFSFCRTALNPQGFLYHKYQPDGAIGTSWHPYLAQGRVIPPIQEDETAITVFLFCQYMRANKDKRAFDDFYRSLVVPACNFMASYIDPQTKLPHASYDLWEEKFLTTTYTTALVYAALRDAADLAERYRHHQDAVRWHTVADDIRISAQHLLYDSQKQYFHKGFINRGNTVLEYDQTIDSSSVYGADMFGLFDSDSAEIKAAYQTLSKLFAVPESGPSLAGRYQNDRYDTVDPTGNGNPWFITTLWLAQRDMRSGKHARAATTLTWVRDHMLSTGVLSEQFNPATFKFISVAPLTWSQAEFINTALDFYKTKRHGATSA